MKQGRDSFYQRSDRRAAMALLAVAAGAAALMAWLGGQGRDAGGGPVATVADTARRAPAPAPRSSAPARQWVGPVEERRRELFAFDPNTADSTALLRLGLSVWQVRNIYKYRARGGVYRSPDDFARLYGLTAGDFRRLRPYIRISPDFLPAAALPAAGQPRPDSLRRPAKLRPGESLELNAADSAALTRVPGIGPYFARAIIRYGARLGGYVSPAQLAEIEGFPAEAVAYFTVTDPSPRRLNLNTMTLGRLRRHPYISFHQAKAIVDYRRQHGRLASLADLRLSRDFTPEAISRLTPYVEF